MSQTGREESHYVGDGCVPEHMESSETVYPYPGPDIKRKDRPEDQPLPHEGIGPIMHDQVSDDLRADPVYALSGPLYDQIIADLAARKELGIKRYGRGLQALNGRDALQDLYEELQDAAVYARQYLIEYPSSRSWDIYRGVLGQLIVVGRSCYGF